MENLSSDEEGHLGAKGAMHVSHDGTKSRTNHSNDVMMGTKKKTRNFGTLENMIYDLKIDSRKLINTKIIRTESPINPKTRFDKLVQSEQCHCHDTLN